MQFNQFCAVYGAICVVQDVKLCSPEITKIYMSVKLYRKFTKISSLRSLLYSLSFHCFKNGHVQSAAVWSAHL